MLKFQEVKIENNEIQWQLKGDQVYHFKIENLKEMIEKELESLEKNKMYFVSYYDQQIVSMQKMYSIPIVVNAEITIDSLIRYTRLNTGRGALTKYWYNQRVKYAQGKILIP